MGEHLPYSKDFDLHDTFMMFGALEDVVVLISALIELESCREGEGPIGGDASTLRDPS